VRHVAARPGRDTFPARLGDDAALRAVRLALPLFCAARHRFHGDDRKRLDRLASLGAPLLAAGAARYHLAERRRLADVLAAIRLGTTVEALGYAAERNAEAHLKPARRDASRLFAGQRDAVEAHAARRRRPARFSLREPGLRISRTRSSTPA
jgi:error-prone DNA polymerase